MERKKRKRGRLKIFPSKWWIIRVIDVEHLNALLSFKGETLNYLSIQTTRSKSNFLFLSLHFLSNSLVQLRIQKQGKCNQLSIKKTELRENIHSKQGKQPSTKQKQKVHIHQRICSTYTRIQQEHRSQRSKFKPIIRRTTRINRYSKRPKSNQE